ncbi:hypothetical protein Tsubulata_020060, partial [Turnera subulata]
ILREKNFKQAIAPVKNGDGEEVTYEKTTSAVFTFYTTGHLNTMFPPEYLKEIARYLYNHQNEDGGWGFDIESGSTMFGTAFSYICLRILDHIADDEVCRRGRKWILDHGSVAGTPSWGKAWLAILGVYDWSGCNPTPPEFWLLPSAFPLNP